MESGEKSLFFALGDDDCYLMSSSYGDDFLTIGTI